MHYLPADFPLIHNSQVFPETNETFSPMNRGAKLNKLVKLRAAVYAKVFSLFHLSDSTLLPDTRPHRGSREFIRNARVTPVKCTKQKSHGTLCKRVAAIRTNLGDLMSPSFHPA